jgi:hypothetical protein
MVRMVGDSLIVRSIGVGVLLCTLASGCAGTEEKAAPATESPTTNPTTVTTSPATTTPTTSPTPTPPKKIPRTFDPKNFGAVLTDVNRWLPMAPGIQTVSKGFVYVGGRRLPHIRVTTVTDVTKMVNGVRAVLVLDQDFDGGQLSEQAIDYLAEDVGGNVWYVGSYTEAYEGGQFLNAEDAWLAAVNGAAPGLYLPAIPKMGTPPYYQVQIPGGEQSTAQVVKVGQRTCVPFKCYTDVVVILEGGSEHKYWAPGVGGILTEPLSGAAQETEELVNIRQLSPGGLAELSAMALSLDRNAADGVPSVFGGSKPAKRGI